MRNRENQFTSIAKKCWIQKKNLNKFFIHSPQYLKNISSRNATVKTLIFFVKLELQTSSFTTLRFCTNSSCLRLNRHTSWAFEGKCPVWRTRIRRPQLSKKVQSALRSTLHSQGKLKFKILKRRSYKSSGDQNYIV